MRGTPGKLPWKLQQIKRLLFKKGFPTQIKHIANRRTHYIKVTAGGLRGANQGREKGKCKKRGVGASSTGGRRRKKVLGEHSRPHLVHGSERKRLRGWGCETDLTLASRRYRSGASRHWSPILLCFWSEGVWWGQWETTARPLSGWEREEKRLRVHFSGHKQSFLVGHLIWGRNSI